MNSFDNTKKTQILKVDGGVVLLAFSLAVLVGLMCQTTVHAQQLYGSITGRVVDATGATVPGADVKVVNEETNFTQATISTETGSYTLLNVPKGEYTMTVAMPGFKNFVKTGVLVTVGNMTREVVELQIGEISEQITVSAAATLLQTDAADIHAQVETKEITDLPMGQFRNYQSLINLVPGATPARFQNAITDTPGRSLTTNMNGTARNNNNTRIDGAQSVNVWLPHHAAYVPPAETIEVANVSTNNFEAEVGFAGGAAVTVITKSGTNEFHGSAFVFHENNRWNARNFFNFLDTDGDGKADQPDGKRTITGATIGGPIVKDKLFFFGGWEGTFQRLARTQTNTLPTEAMRSGDFSAFLPGNSNGYPETIIYDPFTGDPDGSNRTPFHNNVIPEDRMSPAALRMQENLPLPNLSGLTQNFEKSGTEKMDRNNYDVKGDWYRTDEHRLWGKFSLMKARVTKQPMYGKEGGGGAIGGGGDGGADTDVKVYGVGHNWTLSPTFLMDANFGFNDMDQNGWTEDLDLGNYGLEVLGIPGTNANAEIESRCVVDGLNRCGGLPEFNVEGYSNFGQPDGWNPMWRDEDSISFSQNFSWTKGEHEFRFGYDLVKHMLRHWQPESGSGPRGQFGFDRNTSSSLGESRTDQNGWASYLMGVPDFRGKTIQWGLMTGDEWQHAFYFRDRWQVTPKLTLSLGLRWEVYPLVKRVQTDTSVARKMEYTDLDTFETVLDNDHKTNYKMFAPRIGFAYRMTDNDVIRSGYGITYDPMPFIRPLRGDYPLTLIGGWDNNSDWVPEETLDEGVPIFVGPEEVAGARLPLPGNLDVRTMPKEKVHRGYIQSWNLMYERKLPSEFVVGVGYVGTQTVHNLSRLDLNWSPPGGGNQGLQFYPRESRIRYWDGWTSGNYHSLQVSVNRRFTNGLFVKGAYTWGRAISMTDDDGTGGTDWSDPALIYRNRAQTGYNRPHMLQLAVLQELPWGRDGDSALNYIIRDWQINGIFSINQNTPFTVGSDSVMNNRRNAQTADQVKADVEKLGGIGRGDPYYDRSAFAEVNREPGVDCTNYDCYGNSGRNILRGPTWVNLDLSFFRNFPLNEDMRFQFRAEFFNFTNTPHFNNPNSSASSSSFFYITGTSSNAPERVIRFALRFEF